MKMVIKNPSDDKLKKYILFTLVESSWGKKKGLFFKGLTAKIIKKYDFRDFTPQERKEVYQRIKLILNSLVAENIVEFGLQKTNNDFKILYTLSPEWENKFKFAYNTSLFNDLNELTKEQKLTLIKLFKQRKVVYLDELETLSIPNYEKTMQALYYAGLIEFHRHSRNKDQKTIKRNNWRITNKGKKALLRLKQNTGLVFEANIENLNETYFERCVLFILYEYNTLGVMSDFRRICDNAHSKYLLYYAKGDLLEQSMKRVFRNLINNGQITYDLIPDDKSGEMQIVYKLTPQTKEKITKIYSQTIENKTKRLTNEQKELLEKISAKYNTDDPLFINKIQLQERSLAKSLLKMGLVNKYKSHADVNQQKQETFYRTTIEGNNVLKLLYEQNQNKIQQQM